MTDELATVLSHRVAELVGRAPAGADVFDVARSLDVLEVAYSNLSGRAVLIGLTTQGPYAVVLNAKDSRAEQLVSVAHELGHIVLRPLVGDARHDPAVEDACERFAHLLLRGLAPRSRGPSTGRRSPAAA